MKARCSDWKVLYKDGAESTASRVVTEVDRKVQSIILSHLSLSIQQYDLAILSEELEDDGSRFAKDYYWCIDPLDGTLPFIQNASGYCVSISLVRRDGIPVIGVVYDPVMRKRYLAIKDEGIRVNGNLWKSPLGSSGKLNVYFDYSFSNSPDRLQVCHEMNQLAEKLGYQAASIHICGGAVHNACQVLENTPALYFKKPKPTLGGGCVWDYAATSCLFNEAGAYVRDFSGADLKLNDANTSFLNHCGVCFCSDEKIAQLLRDS